MDSWFRSWVSEKYFILYSIIVLIIFVHFIFIFAKTFGDNIDYTHYPVVTDVEVFQFTEEVRDIHFTLQNNDTEYSPEHLMKVFFEKDIMFGSCMKKIHKDSATYGRGNFYSNPNYPCFIYTRSIGLPSSFITQKIANMIGYEAARDLQAETLKNNPEFLQYEETRYHPVEKISWLSFFVGYLVINLLGIGIRCVQDGFSVILSFFSMRFYKAMAVPYGGILMYPNGDPARQAAEAIKVVTMMLISILTCSCASFSKTSTRRSEGDVVGSSLIQTIKSEAESFEVHGWTAGKVFIDEGVVTPAFSNARMSVAWKNDKGLAFSSLIDLATLQSEQPDWLKVLNFSYTISGHTIKVGRFAACGVYSTPPPEYLKTVNYPRVPGFSWGTGVQYSTSFTNEISFIWDVTGTTDTIWNDVNQFINVETSLRIKKIFPDMNAYIAGSVQFSSRENHYVIDGAWNPNDSWFFKGAMYYKDTRVNDAYGGYMLGGYKPIDWLELHTQVDIQKEAGKKVNGILTFGARLIKKFGKLEYSFIIDKEVHTDKQGDGPVMLKMQLAF